MKAYKEAVFKVGALFCDRHSHPGINSRPVSSLCAFVITLSPPAGRHGSQIAIWQPDQDSGCWDDILWIMFSLLDFQALSGSGISSEEAETQMNKLEWESLDFGVLRWQNWTGTTLDWIQSWNSRVLIFYSRSPELRDHIKLNGKDNLR